MRELTDGRGADAVIDAVGMEAHGAPVAETVEKAVGLCPTRSPGRSWRRCGIDRLSSLHACDRLVRRGGTISLIGVYGGAADPLPMIDLFDKQIQIRMGQANVKRWVDDIMPLLTGDEDPLGIESSPHTGSRSTRPRPPTRCSRRSRTAQSKSCSSRDRHLRCSATPEHV